MRKTKLIAGVLAIAATVGIQSTSAALADSHIVKIEIKDEAVMASLTGKAGDPVAGRKVATSRKKGNCLACHVITDLKEQPFHGNVGPPLDGLADRFSAAEVRLRIIDATELNEDTIMPPFYKVDGLHRVNKKFKNKTVLSAQEVEDVLAYVMTLK